MSNEELVVLIQGGELERLPELWAQVERFVAKQAHHRMAATAGFGGVEFADLYISGYIALAAAVESFDPAAGKSFVGWLAMHLKTAFAEAGGYRSPKQAHDPLHRAGSLEAPVGDDADNTALGELIEDPSALLDFERAEERQYRAQLRAALELALEQLPAHERDIVRRRFFRGWGIDVIAAKTGTTPELVRRYIDHALKQLRNPRISRPLRGYLTGRG